MDTYEVFLTLFFAYRGVDVNTYKVFLIPGLVYRVVNGGHLQA